MIMPKVAKIGLCLIEISCNRISQMAQLEMIYKKNFGMDMKSWTAGRQ